MEHGTVKSTYRPINDNTKIVNQVLSIEEVVGSQQEVPGEGTEPRQPMHSVDSISNIDDLFKAFHLNAQHLQNYKDVKLHS